MFFYNHVSELAYAHLDFSLIYYAYREIREI